MSSFYRSYEAQHILGEAGVSVFWSNDSSLLLEGLLLAEPGAPLLGLQGIEDAGYGSIAQASVAAALLLVYLLRLVLPRAPQWCSRFAQEDAGWRGRAPGARSWRFSATAILLLSLGGLILACLSTATHPERPWGWLDMVPWVVAVVVTVVDRPRTTPKTLLAVFCATAVGLLFTLYTTYSRPQEVNVIHVGELCILIGAIGTILCMPMRDPSMSKAGIAGPHDKATNELRSPEDSLTLLQFMTVSWMAPLINAGNRKRLEDEDVWLLPYEFQHERLLLLFRDLRGSLIYRLWLANGLDLVIISLLGILETTANLSGPVFLQRLIVSIEKGVAFRDESIFYAVAILVVRLVACQSAVFSLWYARRTYERSRGEMITTIYAKTLTRKSQGYEPPEKTSAGDSGDGEAPEQGRLARLFSCFKFRKGSKKQEAKAKPPATMGKILNLMRNDCYEVAQRFWDFPQFITKPLQLVLSLYLVWKFLGWPCLFGIAWVLVVQVLNAASVRQLIHRERLRRTATDNRLQATSQFVEAIRHLRWYDWQGKWLDKIMVARTKELHLKVITGLWAVVLGTINISAGALFPVATFFAYTYIAGRPLSVDIAFPALQLFNMLEVSFKELPDLIMSLLNASVAMGRLDAFMSEPDKEEGFSNETITDIEFRDASLAWPGVEQPVLRDLNLTFTTGFTVVCGKVGSGKSALLQGILGELDRVAGDCILPSDMVGYCAQSPWLQHMSIRDNILFSSPYDPIRYRQVLDVCALTPDLANFEHGDLSFIGENGIGLSGGQKARVALARAVYSQSRILLLDDPIAPLDHNTAESIVQKLFCGNLVEGRTVVLVTHRVDLVMHLADQVVEITDGRARILDAEEIPRQITAASKPASQPDEQQDQETATEQEVAAIPDKFIEEEHRNTGGVMLSVYWTYIKAGKLRWWAVVIILFSVFRLARIFSGWFLKAFAEAYNTAGAQLSPQGIAGVALISNAREASFGDQFFDSLPPPYENVGPWLIWYLVIALVLTLLFAICQCVLLLILYVAAKGLFARVLQRVSNATFRFYDVTPIGRLMNRLTSDIGMLDGGIMSPLQNMAFLFLTWASAMAIIAFITPMFFIFALALTAGFVVIFNKFLPTSQSLRRLEMVSLSPLMSNFGILLDGLATIRAFKAQANFQNRNIVVTDAFQQKDHFYWSLQAWLMYRFDSLSAVSTFVLTMIALNNGLSPGLTAFVLTTAAQFVDATHALCKVYGQLQMDFVSVERVIELLELEEEPSGTVDPPISWPAYGDAIRFESVTMKYAPHLEPSLSDVTFTIPGGATCAVLGRTGSGKSTLALALLATLRPEKGHISVGSMDISEVNVHTWRQRISFVAQDPVLFPGTLRQNLDPLEEHTDEECLTVLHRILGPEWTLSSHVDGGGKNLSQGQRQLVGIGRAVLRRSPVVVLDEATASIDKKTALAIQDVLRDELRESTVITIAHRLEAVKDADYLIRLDAGRVVEHGPAKNLH